MSIIKVNCVDQTLVFENTPVIASGGLEENFVQFSFCGQWDGFIKTAVFWRSESEVFHNLLDAEDKCQVAPEVTASDGVIYFGVFGVNDAGRQRTTEVLTYRIVKGAITEGTAPSDPTPDIYTQLIAKYNEMAAIAADTRKKEQTFETAMTERQNTFERNLSESMNNRQETFETEIKQLVADDMVPDNTIDTEKLVNGAVTTGKLADKAVTAGKLADKAVTTGKLADGAVTANKLAADAVDAYTRAQTLKDTTKALYSLGTAAVPDDVLALIKTLLDGKALSGHAHDASAITSGILPLARGGTGVTSLDALAAALNSARIAVGEYRGNDKCQNNDYNYKRSLTFNFAPKMIIFWDKQSHGYQGAGRYFNTVWGRVDGTNEPLSSAGWSEQFGIFAPVLDDSTSGCEHYWEIEGYRFDITFNGNTVTWTGTYASLMYNSGSITYGYIAIG